jgi:hypothetical protein
MYGNVSENMEHCDFGSSTASTVVYFTHLLLLFVKYYKI